MQWSSAAVGCKIDVLGAQRYRGLGGFESVAVAGLERAGQY